ncbi:MAG: helix-turn-helix transcriptional regulator [Rhizomicrobium sp.]
MISLGLSGSDVATLFSAAVVLVIARVMVKARGAGRRKREIRLMAIIVNLDVMLARRKLRSKDLAEAIGITEANLSLLKSGKVKGVRFETLEKICEALQCQPGDLLEYRAG